MRLGELDGDVTGTDDGHPPVVLLHGLTFDRAMWEPLVRALRGRRVVALDLPGHGASPRRESYDPSDVADLLHGAVTAAGLRRPVLDIDQPLLAGPFGEMLRSAEPVLRGPEYLSVWNKLLAGMGVDELAPQRRDLLRSTPLQDLLLGYWREIWRSRRTSCGRTGSGSCSPWAPGVLPDARFTVLPGKRALPPHRTARRGGENRGCTVRIGHCVPAAGADRGSDGVDVQRVGHRVGAVAQAEPSGQVLDDLLDPPASPSSSA
ncbi:alpha/beta hydrolase family protein [Amycolatopsis sp. NPDC006131]|uniref:alpha/beta hydrolase n=1 Tax=Amycolatopsis sp. NPDC006131 TaxID=3156731 RepID=UPI00339E8AC8